MSQTNHKGETGHRTRKLTPEQRRRILEMRKRQKRKKQLMIAVPAAVLVLAVILGFALPASHGRDRSSESLALPTEEPVAAEAGAEAVDPNAAAGVDATVDTNASMDPDATADPNASADPNVAATPEPTENPNKFVPANGVFTYEEAYAAAACGADTGPLLETDISKIDPAKLNRWTPPAEGFIPVLYHANNVDEKVVAITVDDCFQAENLRKIVQCALDHGGKLTIFPIGSNIARQEIGDAVKWAWQQGMEIENHTYNHVGMYHFDDTRMAREMYLQNLMLNQVLGVNYTEHFFRPKGGDEREDQRVHAYANQMGIYAIAIWTQSGSSDSIASLVNNLAPGRIYLFHTTDNDLSKLLQFIPEVVRQGYRLVTMNELFGLPENETSELTTIDTNNVPALEPFHIVIPTLRKTSYVRAAAMVQQRLIELGWLNGEADGVYGQSSFMATGYFQLAADLPADGKSGPATQAVLFSDSAPAATEENKAKVKAIMAK